MITKVYEHTICTILSTSVVINKVEIPILFDGAARNNLNRVTAKYSTNNPEVQKQIESWPDFGVTILLFDTVDDRPVTAEIPIVIPVIPVIIPLPVEVVIPEGFEDAKGISTGVAAKDFLIARFPELRHADVKNIRLCREVAYNNKIIFSELV